LGKRKITVKDRILYIIEYIFVVPLGFLIGLTPRFMLPLWSRFVGWLGFHLNTRDKKWAYYNLDIIYKDNPLSQEEKDRIVRELYRNIARFGIEYMKVGQITSKNYNKYAEYINFEAVERATAQGKGLIVVTLHLGNWEWFGSISAKRGVDLAVIINRQFNPYTDRWLKNIRAKKGKIKVFYNEISEIKNIAKHLRGGGTIALLVDQTYYFKPIFVPFFDMPSATADGPAKFHFKFGAPIMMCYSIYDHSKRKYIFNMEEPVSFEASGNVEEDNKRVMTWINKKYEGYIRKYPEQWFSLLHPRWERTKPEEFEELDFDPY
jgi:KDO2-lipid IV(A) lauroyltransferase